MTQNTSGSVNTSEKEPIAIIGIGCRFPGGANNPEAFWKLLRDGVDAIREVPEDRWNLDNFYDPGGTKPGKIRTRWGGFVDKIDEFDAEFFGISPREASCMDPAATVAAGGSLGSARRWGASAGKSGRVKNRSVYWYI